MAIDLTSNIQSLRLAATEECEEMRRRLERYELLSAKMVAFQCRDGDAPTVDEFLEWRADVEVAREIKRLSSATPKDLS
jgi:hypothetical protein